MLRVYPATFAPTDLLTAGSIGSLPFVLDDQVQQKINGDWCLKFNYPIAKQGAELLVLDALVLAQGQLYRISQIRTTDSAGKQLYEVEAPHIAFDLQHYYIENIETEEMGDLDGITATQAMTQVLDGTPFSVGTVDVDGTHLDYLDILQQSVSEALKQIVKLWGGELYYDNFTIHLRSQCGQNRNYGIRQGKNVDSLKYTEDLSETVTRLHIKGYNGANIEEINDGKDYIDSQYINNYAFIREGYVSFDDEDLPEELLRLGQEHLAKVEVPKITFDISLVNLKGSSQYRFYQQLETYELGDTAILHHTALKADFTLRCQERTFVASTGINKTVKMGTEAEDIEATFTATVNVEKAVEAITTGNHNALNATRLQGTINALKTLLYASADYQAAEIQDNHGILFENTNDESSTYGAMYIGPGAFAIANSKDETGAWDWRTFGTGSGFTADELTAGTISAERIDIANMDLNQNQIFSAAMGHLQSAVFKDDETYTNLVQTANDMTLFMSTNGEKLSYIRFVDGNVEIGKEGETAVFRANNKTMEVTNTKSNKVQITTNMSHDPEWVWMATSSGVGLKYIG